MSPQDMMNEVDSDASNNLIFPAFLALMAKRYSDSNAEDEIREAFRVFDSVSKNLRAEIETFHYNAIKHPQLSLHKLESFRMKS